MCRDRENMLSRARKKKRRDPFLNNLEKWTDLGNACFVSYCAGVRCRGRNTLSR